MPKTIEMESPIVAIGRLLGPRTWPAIAAAMGVLVFVLMAGGFLVDPSQLGWIASGDMSSSYLGWLFFRLAPWSWPPGVLHTTGFEPGSLVAAGSIPLLAFFFKLFERLLPVGFQYLGLWFCACFALQGFFAYRLMALFTRRVPMLMGGVLLCLLSPMLMAHLQGDPALAAQWIVLAALYLYYANPERARPLAWLVLLWLATLVHGCFAAMVLAIWIAHGFQRRLTVNGFILPMVIALAGSVGWMWLAGYFVPPSGAMTSADIGGIAASERLLTWRGIGLGVLAAWLLAIVVVWRMPRCDMGAPDTSRPTSDKGVAIACAVLALVALALMAMPGDYRFLAVSAGAALRWTLTTTAASGALMWPAYYWLILVALRALRRLPARRLGIAVFVLVALQLAGGMSAWHAMHRDFAARAHAEGFPSLDAPFWQQARRRYTHIRLLGAAADTSPSSANLRSVYRYAAGLYGFVVDPQEATTTQAMQGGEAAPDSGRFQSDSLYVMPFETLQTLEKHPASFGATTGMGIVNGLSIVAPGWFDVAGAGDLHPPGDIDYPPVPMNRTVSFAPHGGGVALLAGGWGVQEDTGFSSIGTTASLAFHRPDAPTDLRLVFDVTPYLPSSFPRLGVDIQINGKRAGHWSFDSRRARSSTTLVISSATVAGQKNLTVSFVFDRPRSIQEAEGGADTRQLALFIRSMRLQPAKARIEDEASE